MTERTRKFPQNLIPEGKEFAEKVIFYLDQDYQNETAVVSSTKYGHALAVAAEVVMFSADRGESQEIQRQKLLAKVEDLINKYGEAIIPFLSADLAAVLIKDKKDS